MVVDHLELAIFLVAIRPREDHASVLTPFSAPVEEHDKHVLPRFRSDVAPATMPARMIASLGDKVHLCDAAGPTHNHALMTYPA